MAVANEATSAEEPSQEEVLARAKVLREQVMALYPTGPNLKGSNLSHVKKMKEMSQSKKMVFSMGKFPLLAICFSLIFMGASSFLGGFLFGLWMAGGQGSQFAAMTKSEAGSAQAGKTKEAMASTVEKIEDELKDEAKVVAGGVTKKIAGGLKEGVKKTKLSEIVGHEAGAVVNSALGSAHTSQLPSFLAPLVGAVQKAVSSEVSAETKKYVKRSIDQQLSPRPVKPAPSRAAAPSSSQPVQKESVSPLPSTPPAPPAQPQAAPSMPPSPGMNYRSEASLAGTPPAVEKSNPAGQSSHYTVRVGSFAALENANHLVRQLQSDNFMVHIRKAKDAQKRDVYYVESGMYPSSEMAYSAAEQFSAAGIPGVVVTQDKGQP